MRAGLARLVHRLLGPRPGHVLYVVIPTLLAIALDFAIRGRALLVYPPLEILNYTGSSLASAGFWGGPLWLSAYAFASKRTVVRGAFAAFVATFVLPLTLFSYGGQVLYHRVFGAYMARDTVRLGIALRGTLGEWLTAWGGPWVFAGLVAIALPIAGLFVWGVRRAAPSLGRALPVVPILGFVGASYCFAIDFVESRSLQAAPPDTCFIHGVVHALRDRVEGKGWARHGFTLRRPAPLPPIAVPPHRPNVLVVLTESVRADAVCSAPPPGCADPWLDEVVPNRTQLGTLVTQSPGTFSASMMLWTGLPPDADLRTVHEAPVLWEVARAEGYRTAYVTSQNLRFDDFGAFVENAGIDSLVSAIDLGDTRNAQVGAPDELAAARLLAFVKDRSRGDAPYFALLHFSNTHTPYRTDPTLAPFTPHSDDPTGDVEAFHNHYRNSVAMQQRTLGALLRSLRGLPTWDDTVIVYLSDHGEGFREHGQLYHLHSLHEEEVRVPGWIAAGAHALTDSARNGLSTYRDRRTDTQDVHATVLDLLGAFDAQARFPFGDRMTGRSLLRPRREPMLALMASETAVWEPDDAQYGAMSEDRLLVGSAASPWRCYDLSADAEERHPLPADACGMLQTSAEIAFGNRVRRAATAGSTP